MATNGISSSAIAPHTLTALRDATLAAADPGGRFASLDAQSKGLESHAARFQKPATNTSARMGLGAMSERHISVGSGTDSARARGAGDAIKNILSTLSNAFGSLLNGAKTLVKHLQSYLFSPSAERAVQATAETAVHRNPGLALAAASPRRETGSVSPEKSATATGNHRPGGLQQKLADIEQRAKDHHDKAVALRNGQGRF